MLSCCYPCCCCCCHCCCLLQGRGGAGFVALPGSLFVVAGFAGEETNDVHRFDLATGTWTDSPATAAAAAGSCGGHADDEGPVVELPPRSVSQHRRS